LSYFYADFFGVFLAIDENCGHDLPPLLYKIIIPCVYLERILRKSSNYY
jgi:hypothetical protein